ASPASKRFPEAGLARGQRGRSICRLTSQGKSGIAETNNGNWNVDAGANRGPLGGLRLSRAAGYRWRQLASDQCDGGVGLGSADRDECRPAHRPRMEDLPSNSADALLNAQGFLGGRGGPAGPGEPAIRSSSPSCYL